MRLLLTLMALGLMAESLAAQNPDDYALTFSNSAGGPPGGQATINALIDCPNAAEGVSGWSLGICQDGAEAVALEDGLDTLDVSPAFNETQITADGWTAGAIVDFGAMTTLGPGGNLDIYLITYDLTITSGNATVEYCDTVGSPLVDTVITLNSAPGGIDPMRIQGTIPVVTAAPYELSAGDALGAPGQLVPLTISLDSSTPIEGFSFGLTHNPAVVSLVDIEPGPVVDATNSGMGPDFFGVIVDATGGDGGTVGCAISLDTPFTTIAAGSAQQIAVASYSISGAAPDGAISSIDISGDLGSPVVPILVSVEGLPRDADVESGTITVSGMPTTTFRRGDVTNDGGVDIIDLVIGAQFLFGVGSPLTCEDAMDVDDNGSLEPLIDTIYLATFLFQNGPTLGAPYPNCGSDASADPVQCASYTGPCP